MFTNSRNVVVNGGTFNVHRRDTLTNTTNGLDVLREHIASGALHDSAERSTTATCYPNTRLAVLDEIMRWIADQNSERDVLWIHGPAGSGKTVICQTIAERCQDEGNLAASFFFDRVGLDRNDEKSFIATIAYQIAHCTGEAKPYIAAAVLKDALIFKKAMPTQTRELILHPIKAMEADDPTILIPKVILIDGLDECQLPEGGPLTILRTLQTALKKPSFPFRVIISSRMDLDIRDVFEGDMHHLTHIMNLGENYDPKTDIATFFRSNFSAILKKHRRNRSMASLPLPWPSEQVIQLLVSKSSGQFIYAATVIKFVDVRHQLPSQRLDLILGFKPQQEGEDFSPFAELDQLYQQIFRTVFDLPVTLRVLGALFMVRGNLSIESLEELLGLQPGDIDMALCNLHSVLTIPDISENDRHVIISHASLQDFLFDRRRAREYYTDPNNINSDLSQCCHRLLMEWLENVNGIYAEPTVRHHVYRKEYVYDNILFHTLAITEFDDRFLTQLSKIDPQSLFRWALDYDKLASPMRKDTSTKLNHSHMPALDQLSTLVARLKGTDHPQAQVLAGTYTKEFSFLFKESWQPRFRVQPDILPRTMAILAVTLKGSPVHVHAIKCLLQIDWKDFGLSTLVLVAHMDFHNLVVFNNKTFEDYIKDPSRCGEYYPLTPDIHADMVIYCLEFMKDYHPTSMSSVGSFMAGDDRHAKFEKLMGEQGAIFYANKLWKEHLREANPRRVLNYTYFAVVRSGYYPICTHQVQCHIRCEVVGLYKCIESTIIDCENDPTSISEADSKLFPLLREILKVKYMDTPLFSNMKTEMETWKNAYRKEGMGGARNPCKYIPPDDIIIGDYEDHTIQEILTNSRASRPG